MKGRIDLSKWEKQPDGSYRRKRPGAKAGKSRRKTSAGELKAPSKLEASFLWYWKALKGPDLIREFKFSKSRRWRADFAHLESRTLIEIEGGVHVNGRHNRASGFFADAEKYLEAVLSEWRVLRLTEKQINAQTLERVISYLEK